MALEQLPETVSILGTPVTAFRSLSHAVAVIRERIVSRERTFCVAINPEKIVRAREDARLSGIIAGAEVRICDGIGASLAASVLHRRRLPRVTGADLFLTLMGLAAEEGWKIFLLGASPESNQRARAALAASLPSLRIAGTRHGYFEDSAEVVQRINESGADLLFVALGSPRQEYWIYENRALLRPVFCMGVGGSLDVVGGVAHRAPALLRKTGLEWLYRLALQPSRIRRQASLPLFALEVLRAATHRQPQRTMARGTGA
jgi:N-acetylglucosaminyldiphosphoundecaprenol N-acetyl-beta-D-mannosaminyltransferase